MAAVDRHDVGAAFGTAPDPESRVVRTGQRPRRASRKSRPGARGREQRVTGVMAGAPCRDCMPGQRGLKQQVAAIMAGALCRKDRPGRRGREQRATALKAEDVEPHLGTQAGDGSSPAHEVGVPSNEALSDGGHPGIDSSTGLVQAMGPVLVTRLMQRARRSLERLVSLLALMLSGHAEMGVRA